MQPTCPDCGTINYEAARFCRKCGRNFVDESDLEASTRSLDDPVRPQSKTNERLGADPRPFAATGGGPKYVPPQVSPGGDLMSQRQAGMAGSVQTNPLVKSSSWARPVMLLFVVVLLLIIGAAIPAAFFLHSKRTSTTPPPARSVAPTPPAVPPVPAPPPPPTPPPAGTSQNALPEPLTKWGYPNAKVNSRMITMDGSQPAVADLKTSDPVEQVVEYYKSRVPPNTMHTVEGEESAFIFDGNVIHIEGGDDGTDIHIVINSSGSGRRGPPSISIPTPPTPPSPPG